MQQEQNKQLLREVLYRTKWSEFDPDQPYEDKQPLKGYFHVWCEQPTKSPYDDSFYRDTVAIVEDAESGKLLKISTELLEFVNH